MDVASQSSEDEIIDLRGKSSSKPALSSTKSKLAKLAYVPPLAESPSPPPLPRSKRPLPRANTNADPPLFLPKSTGSSSPNCKAAPLPKKVVAQVENNKVASEGENEDEEMMPFVPETLRTSKSLAFPSLPEKASELTLFRDGFVQQSRLLR